MEERVFQPGTDIISTGEKCSEIIFMVNGLVELLVFDLDGESYILDEMA